MLEIYGQIHYQLGHGDTLSQSICLFHSLTVREDFFFKSFLYILHKLLTFILSSDGIQRVSTAEEASFKSGVHELLELLMNSEQPGWFSAFINALNENGLFTFSG